MSENNPFSILRQANVQYVETREASAFATMADVAIQSSEIENLHKHAAALRTGEVLPVGSVEFVRDCMRYAGITEPINISYPERLVSHLRRQIWKVPAGHVLGRWFVKPVSTKVFTGFVFDTLIDPATLSEYDQEQHQAFMSMPADAEVWISEEVTWLSEVRYYVLDGCVIGEGRYDDGPDDAPLPDFKLATEMAFQYAAAGAPKAFSIDVGVLSAGETALVECNDAWALGYYKGTLTREMYFHQLWHRWSEMVEKHKTKEGR